MYSLSVWVHRTKNFIRYCKSIQEIDSSIASVAIGLRFTCYRPGTDVVTVTKAAMGVKVTKAYV